jgi:hypothetical protein
LGVPVQSVVVGFYQMCPVWGDGGTHDVPTEQANYPVPVRQAAAQISAIGGAATQMVTGGPAAAESLEPMGADRVRRTGTDHPVVHLPAEGSTEQCSDHSASDGMREQHLDPTQDDTGSQPD